MRCRLLLALAVCLLSARPLPARTQAAPTRKAAAGAKPLPAEPPTDTTKVYTYVEQMPQPPGGMEGLVQYLGRNFKYPCTDWRNMADIPTKVLVRFIVRRSGHITDVTVVKKAVAPLDEEAVRVISRLPPWQPGRQHGQPVHVSYTIPISIDIR